MIFMRLSVPSSGKTSNYPTLPFTTLHYTTILATLYCTTKLQY